MWITAIQMNSTDHLAQNIERIRQLVDEAHTACPAALYVLPEWAVLYGASYQRLCDLARSEAQLELRSWFAGLAQEYSAAIHCGTLCGDAGGKLTNDSVVFGPDGSALASYRKVFLIDATLDSGRQVSESAKFLRGTKGAYFDHQGTRFGLATCFDFRFPELFRYYRRQGVDAVLYVTSLEKEQDVTRQEILLRARAIETQMYIICASQCGLTTDGRRHSNGLTMIVAPNGMVHSALYDKPGFIHGQLSHWCLEEVRHRLDVLKSIDDVSFDEFTGASGKIPAGLVAEPA